MPTALELGPEGWKPYIEASKRQGKQSHVAQAKHDDQEMLMVRVREVAATLKRRFNVQRVMLFGSLAHDAWYAWDSDVDLAVEGLAGDDYWQAWRVAEDIIRTRPVDLIEIEAATKSMKKAIERHGVEL